MVTTGTVELLGPFPVIKDGTFQNCNHQTGTYQRWAAAFLSSQKLRMAKAAFPPDRCARAAAGDFSR
jgi:hypothetical protein